MSEIAKAPVPIERLAASLRELRRRLHEPGVPAVYDRGLDEAAVMLEVPAARPSPAFTASERVAVEAALAEAGLDVR